MAPTGMLMGPDGHYHPPWDPRHGPMPPDYPVVPRRRARAVTPAPAPVVSAAVAAPAEEDEAVFSDACISHCDDPAWVAFGVEGKLHRNDFEQLTGPPHSMLTTNSCAKSTINIY